MSVASGHGRRRVSTGGGGYNGNNTTSTSTSRQGEAKGALSSDSRDMAGGGGDGARGAGGGPKGRQRGRHQGSGTPGNGKGNDCRSSSTNSPARNEEQQQQQQMRRSLGSSSMRYSPSGSHLAVGCSNGSLVIMTVDTGNETGIGGNRGGKGGTGGAVAGGGAVVGGGSGGSGGRSGGGVGVERTYGAPNRDDDDVARAYRRIAHLKGHSSRVLHLDWSSDGTLVQTCGQDYQTLRWEILPPPPGSNSKRTAEEPGGVGGREISRRNSFSSLRDGCNRGGGGRGGGGGGGGGGGREAETRLLRPHMFQRNFLLRDVEWATWSSTIGWPVQGVFPAYSDNTEVNAVDLCPSRGLLATADDTKTVRLLRFPALRGGARAWAYTGHSSHVMGARFLIGVEPMKLITIGGHDSTVMQWTVEKNP